MDYSAIRLTQATLYYTGLPGYVGVVCSLAFALSDPHSKRILRIDFYINLIIYLELE